MNQDLISKLPDRLQSKLVPHFNEIRLIEHPPVITCYDVVKTLNIPVGKVIKCIVLNSRRGKKVVGILPGDKKIDFKIMTGIVNENGLTFLSPEQVKKDLRQEIGSISPFLIPKEVKAILDYEITLKNEVYCGTGVQTISLILSGELMRHLFEGDIASISKV